MDYVWLVCTVPVDVLNLTYNDLYALLEDLENQDNT